MVVFLGCGVPKPQPLYRANLSKLRPEQRIHDVYPVRIQRYERELYQVQREDGFYGTQADYKGQLRLEIYELRKPEGIVEFWQKHLPGYFNEHVVYFQEAKNGHLHLEARGKRGEILLAFGQFPWVLVVEATQEQLLDELVKNFPYLKKVSR